MALLSTRGLLAAALGMVVLTVLYVNRPPPVPKLRSTPIVNLAAVSSANPGTVLPYDPNQAQVEDDKLLVERSVLEELYSTAYLTGYMDGKQGRPLPDPGTYVAIDNPFQVIGSLPGGGGGGGRTGTSLLPNPAAGPTPASGSTVTSPGVTETKTAAPVKRRKGKTKIPTPPKPRMYIDPNLPVVPDPATLITPFVDRTGDNQTQYLLSHDVHVLEAAVNAKAPNPKGVDAGCVFEGCPHPPYLYFVTSLRNRAVSYNRMLRSLAVDLESGLAPIDPRCVCAAVGDFVASQSGVPTREALRDWPYDSSVAEVNVAGFVKSVGYEAAVQKAVKTHPDHSLIMLMDADMVVFPGFINSIFTYTHLHKHVYLPVVWSTQGPFPGGWWRTTGTGNIGFYLSDLTGVGGFVMKDSKSWGKEDHALATKFYDYGVLPQRECRRDIWHLEHLKVSWKRSSNGQITSSTLKRLADDTRDEVKNLDHWTEGMPWDRMPIVELQNATVLEKTTSKRNACIMLERCRARGCLYK